MKIYNEDKTKILSQEEINYDIGYIKQDKLFIAHHEATPFLKGKSAEEIYNQLKAQGISVRHDEGKYYKVIATYDSGGEDVEEIEPEEDIPVKEAWDEYEDIQVFVHYGEEELKERFLNNLRRHREPLLNAFDKWEKAVLRGRERDSDTIMAWYEDLLDLEERAFENVPERVEYYL